MNSYKFPTKDFNKRQNPVKLTRREVLTIDYSPAPSLLAWFGASAIHPLFANFVVGLSIKNSICVIISISISIRIQLFIRCLFKFPKCHDCEYQEQWDGKANNCLPSSLASESVIQLFIHCFPNHVPQLT